MKRLLALPAQPLFWGLLALIAALALLTPWAYPGEATALMARLLGAWDAADPSAHPLVALLFGALGRVLPAAWAVTGFNVATALAGALCVWLLGRLAAGYFLLMTDEPRSRPFVGRAAGWAAALSGLALLLSPDFLRAATHFQWQTVDLLLMLCASLLLLRTAETGSTRRLSCAAFAWGLVAPEAPLTVAVAPLALAALAWGWVCARDRFRWRPLLTHLAVPALVGALLATSAAVALSLAGDGELSVRAAASLFLRRQTLGILEAFRGPWLLMGLFGVVPFALALFAGREICANRRTPAVLGTYLTAAALVCVALSPLPAAPRLLAGRWADAWPVALAAMTAFAAGFVGGAGALLRMVGLPAEGARDWAGLRRLGGMLACMAMGAVTLAALLCGGWATVRAMAAERVAADLPRVYADRVLDAARGRETWLLGDGVAEPYLALRIAGRGLPVTLLSLTQEDNPKALARVRAALAASPHFAANPALREALGRSLDLRLFAFLQDWLRADDAAPGMFVTLSLPDLWYVGDRLPLPEGLWYRGAKDRAAQHAALAKAGPGVLDAAFPGIPSEAAGAGVRDFARYVRRQCGFVANNTAFYLADAGRKEEAYDLFLKIYAYDPENVSALFNLFELVNAGLHPERRDWCEREIAALTKRLAGRRYRLWALARTYGYIRSPQLISALAGAWAMSGQTGAALSGLDLAWEMLDDGQRTALQGAMAALYGATPGRRGEAIRRTKELLGRSTDPKRSLAYLRELVRMTILEGDLAEAKALLERAEVLGGKGAADMGYERALYHASAGEPAKARIALQAYLDRHPKSPEATAMLATLQLQAGELEELRAVTLPKLLTAAGTEDDYFYRIVTAQLAERDGDLTKARAAYLRALALRPEVHALRTTVLALDIRMDDKSAAARHARQFLYQDRTLPLANYVMGALALGEGDLRRANDYLTLATAPEANPPIPEAFNDLAETQRRLGRWAAALSAAQRASELAPKLPVAHETAAAALLGLGRLAEAHAELDKAEALDAEARPGRPVDPRILITRARVHAQEGHPDLARAALAKAKAGYDTLDKGAKAEFDATADAVGLRR